MGVCSDIWIEGIKVTDKRIFVTNNSKHKVFITRKSQNRH